MTGPLGAAGSELIVTVAALFGALPLAIGMGAGSELRQPLGIAIVGGLGVSQLLNLFSTPAVYVCLDGLRSRKKEHLYKPAHASGAPTPAPG